MHELILCSQDTSILVMRRVVLREVSRAQTDSMFTRHVLPFIGSIMLGEVSRAQTDSMFTRHVQPFIGSIMLGEVSRA